MSEYTYQVLRLTDEFYRTYPDPPYHEILKKRERPYNCLLIQTHYDYFICIPFRSEIRHEYSYQFTSSERSRKHHSGLDYTKIVIVNREEYIDTADAIVDRDEYVETMKNIKRIVSEANRFVDDYVLHHKKEKLLHMSEFNRRYRFSPLQYFHKELGIG